MSNLEIEDSSQKKLIDRKERPFNEHYKNLTPDQLMSVYSLNKIGYILSFVRVISKNDVMAFLLLGSDYASVDSLGEIDLNPDVTIR